MRRRLLPRLALLLLLLPAATAAAQAQDNGRYYPKTGHSLYAR